MKYAVIKIQGHQYKVSEGEDILVDKIEGEVKPEILLLVTDKEVKVGTPTIDGAKISIKKLEDEKGDKIIVKKYKAKSRYRRKIGFRPQFTHLQIEKIS